MPLQRAQTLRSLCRALRRSEASAKRSGAHKPLLKARALRRLCRALRQSGQAIRSICKALRRSDNSAGRSDAQQLQPPLQSACASEGWL
eukprot:125317-Pyramimonas_sp.AAC.1